MIVNMIKATSNHNKNISFQRSKKNPTLSSEQTEALSRLRKHLKGPSRVCIVLES
jgi:superfamily II DNA or RNA helicase